MAKTVTATEARIHFGEWIRLATEQRTVVWVERAGVRAVAIIAAEDLENLQRRAASAAVENPWVKPLQRCRELREQWRQAGGPGASQIDDVEDVVQDERRLRNAPGHDSELEDDLRRR